jgi:uncharacterized protein YjbI with pentapeptide repeats
MKIVKPDNLALLTTPCRMDGTLYLSIGALACFTLEPVPQHILSEADLWQTAMAALDEGDVLDQGCPKPRGEFIVHAAACSALPTAGLEVTARVGNLSKTLVVTGDRQWTTWGAPGVPEPFLRLPVTYRNAFGGPGYAYNPTGKGFRAEAGGKHPLPNIQDPRRPVTSPKETAPPAGFAPYPASWPQRQSLLGCFNNQWLTDCWPDLPRDASPEYFNIAPEDQRLTGFFRGDEQIRLTGMHPEKSVIVSRLPGLRARVFVEQACGGEKAFFEVENHAETLMLYPEALRAILLFRGIIPVVDEELDDVTCLLAAWESQTDALQPMETHIERMRQALKPPPSMDFATPPSPVDAAPAENAAPDPQPPLPEFEPLNREIAAMEAQTDQRLQSLGMSREELLKKYGAEESGREAVTLESLTGEIEELERTADQRLQELGISRGELLSMYAPEADAPDPRDLSALPGKVRELVAHSTGLMTASKLEAAGLWSNLPKEIQGEIPSLAEVEDALSQWEKETGQAQAVAGEENSADVDASRPGAVLSAAEVMARHRSGASLRGIDASGEDFSGCDLQAADFTESVLNKARFAGANLSGAVFTQAVLQAADFRGADLTGALLKGATGPGADFTAAKLVRADLSAGDWTGANMAGADLHDANLSRAILRKADLSACIFRGAVARDADFSEGNLFAVDFSGGDLCGADCSGADLNQAVLAGVRAQGLRLFGVAADQTDFSKANLAGARAAAGTVLTGVRLGGADLTGASLGGTQFIGVDLEGAALDGGDFSRAIFERSSLRNATARGSSFMKARFLETAMRGIDLLQGSLRKATLEKIDLRDANLYGVDFFGACLKETDTTGSNLKQTLLTLTPKL